MIEYLYDVIRATAGQEILVSAKLTNDDGSIITDNCNFHLFDDKGNMLYEAPGTVANGLWLFSVPAQITEGRKGKHWYCIGHGKASLCFKEPIYLK